MGSSQRTFNILRQAAPLTSMISLCQGETEIPVDAASVLHLRSAESEGAGHFGSTFWPHSRGSCVVQNQTSICGLWPLQPSPKNEFGFTCRPRNN